LLLLRISDANAIPFDDLTLTNLAPREDNRIQHNSGVEAEAPESLLRRVQMFVVEL
jgi:hypothetical protein